MLREIVHGVPELMDRSDLDRAQTERALDDLARVNRCLLGWHSAIRSFVEALGGEPTARVIDVGTGGGDVIARIQEAAKRRGVTLQVIGVDRKLGHLLHARDRKCLTRGVVADVGALPFREHSIDIGFSSLLLHHFDEAGAREMLDEMARTSERVLVVDLRQSRVARLFIRPLLAVLRVGPIATFDGVVSVRQAWSLEEVRAMVAARPAAVIRRRFPYRFSLAFDADPTS